MNQIQVERDECAEQPQTPETDSLAVIKEFSNTHIEGYYDYLIEKYNKDNSLEVIVEVKCLE